MRRLTLLLYGAVAYAAFFATFLYTIGFVGCVGVPKCVDSGAVTPLARALLVDSALLLLFAVQHSIMARRWFKTWWTRIVPRPAERSTYVLLATAILALLMWQWQPITSVVWDVPGAFARDIIWIVYAVGWTVVLTGTYMIDHFDLFGLRQVWIAFRGREYTHPPFQTRGFYRYTRNPLMLGFLIAFWAAPTMTVGRLVFAAASTAYLLVGIVLEERDHAFYLGEVYRRYRARTPMLLPLPKMGGSTGEHERTGEEAAS
jgi:protein-S-isoprenylcysteine O-methyltransferase Ste14